MKKFLAEIRITLVDPEKGSSTYRDYVTSNTFEELKEKLNISVEESKLVNRITYLNYEDV